MEGPESPWARPPAPPPPPRPSRVGLYAWLAVLAVVAGLIVVLMRAFPGQLEDGDGSEVFRLFGILAVVSSGLVAARRIQVGVVARNLAIWALIVGVVVVGYVMRSDFADLGARVRSAFLPSYPLATAAHAMVIGRAEDGAFYVTGPVNGVPVRFLIDTGASDIVLSPADADRLGMTPAPSAYSRRSETANGVAYGAPDMVRSLSIGQVTLRDVPVTINKAPMGSSLLGMPFLRAFASIDVRGDQLFLRTARER